VSAAGSGSALALTDEKVRPLREFPSQWKIPTIVETAMSKLLNKENKAAALYKRAEQCWTEGRLPNAFKLFLAAAKVGFVPAYRTLASFYDQGTGVKSNRRAALYWYMRAYRQHDTWYRRGDSTSANNIGCIWRDRRKSQTAIMWFKRAVRLGDGDANLNIAKIYLGSNRDRQKAVRYLQRTINAKYATDGSIEEASKLLAEIRKTTRKTVRRSN
jgi:TPR repeat protein